MAKANDSQAEDTKNGKGANESELDIELDEEGEEGADAKKGTKDDKKSDETSEQRIARLKRQLKREQQKLGVAEEDAENEKGKPSNKPFKLGYEHKAYLNANGIKGVDEYSLVTDFLSNTGKELEDIVDSKYFQSELKSLREMRETKIASDAAAGNKRGTSSARDTVEYWLNKGPNELPPAYMTQLRREVVNARIKQSSSSSPFKNN